MEIFLNGDASVIIKSLGFNENSMSGFDLKSLEFGGGLPLEVMDFSVKI